MAEFKLVLGTKDGKTVQKEVKGEQADFLLNKHIGDRIKGDSIGFVGYEFHLTGGSDKSGFPMRKGILQVRKSILTGKNVGFKGKDRNEKKQPGLIKRRTVCGEIVTKDIVQVNMKVLQEGAEKLISEPAKEE